VAVAVVLTLPTLMALMALMVGLAVEEEEPIVV
jgi:hypothetical protein